MRDYAKIAKRYAQDVRDGLIPACRFVQLAAERHLTDLARMGSADFPFEFDEIKAAAICRFLELMPHTKGQWARRKEKIKLENWQVFSLAVGFGWVKKSDGFRRFRIIYIEVPRKNGKSQLAAGIGLYMLCADGDFGAEVYSGATTQKQAWEVFRPAHRMVELTEELREAAGIELMASNISVPENGGRFEPIIGKPGDGATPSCAIVDEFHEHKTDELYETMITGMGAREQPLMLVLTTAGSDIAGPCYALRTDVTHMLTGTVPNDELFGIIYTIDEGDEWTAEESLIKANPNYNISIKGDFLKSQVKDAMNSPRRQSSIKTKHLNIWVNARDSWMNLESWQLCARPDLKEEDFKGEPCWVGLDLASKIDITSVVKIFIRDVISEDAETFKEYFLFGRHYVPEAQAKKEDKRHYQNWVQSGELIATPGNVIDFDRIREDLIADSELFRIVNVGYDPFGATQLAMQLDGHGVPVIEVKQTVTQLSEPMKWIEALVLDRRLFHDNNSCMNWMIGNVTAKPDAKDNIFPRKERDELKIDGLVAGLNAMRVSMMIPETKESIYKARGIRTT